ncbi:hypothetical protein BK140_17000 [Paenibacillus macerans]|nr:hypothetical protein BK140_17000 [Paenibacillus macerans]
MNNRIRKWLEENIVGFEFCESENGGYIVFIPIAFQDKAIKYFKRYGFRYEYRASYTWIAFFTE